MDLDGEIARERAARSDTQRKAARQADELTAIVEAAYAEMRQVVTEALPRILKTSPHIEVKYAHRPFDHGIPVPVAKRGSEVWPIAGDAAVRRNGSVVSVDLSFRRSGRGNDKTQRRNERKFAALMQQYAGHAQVTGDWQFRPITVINGATNLSSDYPGWAWRDGHLVYGTSTDYQALLTWVARALA